eukprot:CAMPEP_0202883478 /NCGR_PEP_ID=MMETSP1391-20130828/39526_1 /ASSEMBLY_ACC=CAM_ASM_000867 /TAXON_ID=1034604 /ORGANISM="Chlamydomonas leiostraca, Strain SAG 11-49" /LENGTH=39 /DNA_ID= /DNA_START= /DNA_END= /DNA_ORIENTATION=
MPVRAWCSSAAGIVLIPQYFVRPRAGCPLAAAAGAAARH